MRSLSIFVALAIVFALGTSSQVFGEDSKFEGWIEGEPSSEPFYETSSGEVSIQEDETEEQRRARLKREVERAERARLRAFEASPLYKTIRESIHKRVNGDPKVDNALFADQLVEKIGRQLDLSTFEKLASQSVGKDDFTKRKIIREGLKKEREIFEHVLSGVKDEKLRADLIDIVLNDAYVLSHMAELRKDSDATVESLNAKIEKIKEQLVADIQSTRIKGQLDRIQGHTDLASKQRAEVVDSLLAERSKRKVFRRPTPEEQAKIDAGEMTYADLEEFGTEVQPKSEKDEKSSFRQTVQYLAFMDKFHNDQIGRDGNPNADQSNINTVGKVGLGTSAAVLTAAWIKMRYARRKGTSDSAKALRALLFKKFRGNWIKNDKMRKIGGFWQATSKPRMSPAEALRRARRVNPVLRHGSTIALALGLPVLAWSGARYAEGNKILADRRKTLEDFKANFGPLRSRMAEVVVRSTFPHRRRLDS